jgi:hypothetical protein
MLADLLADFMAVDDTAEAKGRSVPSDAAILADFLGKIAPKEPQRAVIPSRVPVAEPEDYRRPDLRAMCAEQCAADPARLPWPDEWFAPVDSGSAAACSRLWSAALVMIIKGELEHDAKHCRIKNLPRGTFMGYVRSRDFHTVCALAGFDGLSLIGPLTDPARIPAIEAALYASRTGEDRRVRHKRSGVGA